MSEEHVPELEGMTAVDLNNWLRHFSLGKIINYVDRYNEISQSY